MLRDSLYRFVYQCSLLTKMLGVREPIGYFNQQALSDVTFVLKEGIFSETGNNKLYAHWFQLCLGSDYFVGMHTREEGKKEIEVETDISRAVYYIYQGTTAPTYTWHDNPAEAIVDLHLAKQMYLDKLENSIINIVSFLWKDHAVEFLTNAMAIDDSLVKELFKAVSHKKEILDVVVNNLLAEDKLTYIPMVAMEALIGTVFRYDLRTPQNAIRLYNYWRSFHPDEQFNVKNSSTEPDLHGYTDLEIDIGIHGSAIPDYVPINKFLLGDTPPYELPDKDIMDVHGNDFGSYDLMLIDEKSLFDYYPDLANLLFRYEKMLNLGLASLDELDLYEEKEAFRTPSPKRIPPSRHLIRRGQETPTSRVVRSGQRIIPRRISSSSSEEERPSSRTPSPSPERRIPRPLIRPGQRIIPRRIPSPSPERESPPGRTPRPSPEESEESLEEI